MDPQPTRAEDRRRASLYPAQPHEIRVWKSSPRRAAPSRFQGQTRAARRRRGEPPARGIDSGRVVVVLQRTRGTARGKRGPKTTMCCDGCGNKTRPFELVPCASSFFYEASKPGAKRPGFKRRKTFGEGGVPKESLCYAARCYSCFNPRLETEAARTTARFCSATCRANALTWGMSESKAAVVSNFSPQRAGPCHLRNGVGSDSARRSSVPDSGYQGRGQRTAFPGRTQVPSRGIVACLWSAPRRTRPAWWP